MRLLITGGREFNDREYGFERLDIFHAVSPVTCVIHGNAVGADTIGKEWALARGIEHEPYPVTQADWDRLGNYAGSARNGQMLREGKPEHLFVLPGGQGTIDMVIRAKQARLPITFASRI